MTIEASPDGECVFHPDRGARSLCGTCHLPLCAGCVLPLNGATHCPDCYLEVAPPERVGGEALGRVDPMPLVLGGVGACLSLASTAFGIWWPIALGLNLVAVVWGVERQATWRCGPLAVEGLLAWLLGAIGLVVCFLKVHFYGWGWGGWLVAG